ncbi:MAG TPA: FAD-binding protein, partial [Thermoanaerobaculia bacterium]|nr:FAD-binding protein [Thermoanaerobaculia bacterium]
MKKPNPSAARELPSAIASAGLPHRRAALRSFDGGVGDDCWMVRPDRYRDLERFPAGVPRIVRGGGYSYAAASFGGGAIVQDFRCFDRVL